MRALTLLTAVGASFCWECAPASAPPSAPSDALGKPVAPFTLPSDDGSALVTLPVPGRSYVLDFFAPTCLPCRASVPALVSKRDALQARGATLVLIAVLGGGEQTSDARGALDSWGVHERFLVESGEASKAALGVRELPATLVIDTRGVLRWVAPPSVTAGDVVAAIP